jgi:hypothetical protein
MEFNMTEPKYRADWYGATLDIVVIASLTLLAALHIASLAVFLAVTCPIVGARLAAARLMREGGGALGVLLGLFVLLRRSGA